MTSLLERVRRVLSLDADVFAEVAADSQATGQAVAVVIGVALLHGLGEPLGSGASGWLVGVADACVRWLLWSAAIHLAARLVGLASDLGALVRALGFASAPLALGVLSGLPWVGGLVWLLKWGLAIAAFVLAVRRVLALETGPAIVLCLAGLVLAALLAVPAGWLYPGG